MLARTTIVWHNSSIGNDWVVQGDDNPKTPKSVTQNGADSSLSRHQTIGEELFASLIVSIVGVAQMNTSIHTLPFPSRLSRPAVELVRGALLTARNVLGDVNM